MLFNSYIFLFLFLPVLLVGYYGLNRIKQEKLAMVFLCSMSLWFYGYSNIYYMGLLVVSIILNYSFALGMEKKPALKKAFLALGVILNLGLLGYFKYYDFFVDNVNTLFKTDIALLHLVLPIGISFFTFQQLSFLVDFYRGECERYSFIEYAAYVSYFPQLIAGPIVYHSELIPQFRKAENKKFHAENMSRGLYAFACGLGKKVLIADSFSKIVAIGFSDASGLTSLSVIFVAVCYSVQLYFDFSGYSDMAYGLGYMCNVVLPINFNSPFKAESIIDLWRRWHITLTRFFTKYVYIPLGGNRKGTVRTFVNTIIVFLLSGLWHGANWTFVCWGGINGIGIALNRQFRKGFDKLPYWFRRGVSFLFFVFVFVMFRSDSVRDAGVMFRQLFVGGTGGIDPRFSEVFNGLLEMKVLYRLGFGTVIESIPWLFMVIVLCIILFACFFWDNTQEKVAKMTFGFRENVAMACLIVWSILSLSKISEFLYYNF